MPVEGRAGRDLHMCVARVRLVGTIEITLDYHGKDEAATVGYLISSLQRVAHRATHRLHSNSFILAKHKERRGETKEPNKPRQAPFWASHTDVHSPRPAHAPLVAFLAHDQSLVFPAFPIPVANRDASGSAGTATPATAGSADTHQTARIPPYGSSTRHGPCALSRP